MRNLKWRLIKHPYWALRYALAFYRMNSIWATLGGFQFGWKFAAKLHAYCETVLPPMFPDEFCEDEETGL